MAYTNLIADRSLRSLMRTLRLAFTATDGKVSEARLRKAVRDRDALGAERTLLDEWTKRSAPRLSAALEAGTFVPAAKAARVTADATSTLSTVWGKDAVNRWAVQWARSHSARLVTLINAEQRAVIQQATTRVMQADWTTQKAARHLRQVIGLNRQGERRLARFATSGKGEPQIARFRTKLINERAETIARTETVSAANHGQLRAWREARAEGFMPVTAEKRWTVTADDRLCPVCAPMAGEQVSLDGLFTGGVECPPRHPRCRCALVTAAPKRKPSIEFEASPTVPVDSEPALR